MGRQPQVQNPLAFEQINQEHTTTYCPGRVTTGYGVADPTPKPFSQHREHSEHSGHRPSTGAPTSRSKTQLYS